DLELTLNEERETIEEQLGEEKQKGMKADEKQLQLLQLKKEKLKLECLNARDTVQYIFYMNNNKNLKANTEVSTTTLAANHHDIDFGSHDFEDGHNNTEPISK
ncbi:unnamed protein product, partial [Adineta steineri]